MEHGVSPWSVARTDMSEQLPGRDALRKVGNHSVHTDGECARDVREAIRGVDPHHHVLSMECVDKRAGGSVVPKADVLRLILHRIRYRSARQPIEQDHERSLCLDRSNMCELLV